MMNKIINTKILWIVFVIIIGFVMIEHFDLYEGIMYVDGKYNTNTQKVLIQPVSGNDYLHLSQFMLYGENGKIDYNATSSAGIRDSYGIDKLTDNDKTTIFHSDKKNCTLTITPKNGSSKITKIQIRNRLDCCLDRLRGYNLSIIRNDGSVFFSKNLNEVDNLYRHPYMEEILIN